MKKQTNKKEKLEIYTIEITIRTNDYYDYDAFIQSKAGIKKLIKDNPCFQRLVNGLTAY